MALWPVDVFTIEQSLSDEYVIMLFLYDPLPSLLVEETGTV
jgi:hypothetical protein